MEFVKCYHNGTVRSTDKSLLPSERCNGSNFYNMITDLEDWSKLRHHPHSIFSLKNEPEGGAKGSAAKASFSELVLREKTASGKVGNLLLVFHFSRLARAVGMWESRSDFQGLGKTKGNLVLVFLV